MLALRRLWFRRAGAPAFENAQLGMQEAQQGLGQGSSGSVVPVSQKSVGILAGHIAHAFRDQDRVRVNLVDLLAHPPQDLGARPNSRRRNGDIGVPG